MNKLMLRKAEVARKRPRPTGLVKAPSARSVTDLRVAALSRVRSTSIKPDSTAAAARSKAAVARAQMRKG